MLYLNEERVDLNKKKVSMSALEKEAFGVIEDFYKEISNGSADPKKVKWPIHFQFHPKFRSVNAYSKVAEWPAPKRYRCVKTITSKNQSLSGDWIYSANAIKRDKEKNMNPNPSHYVLGKDAYVNESQLDLLFFLIFIMADRYNDEFIVRSEILEAKKEVEYDLLETNVMQVIFTNQYLKEKDVRQIAASYGVRGVKNLDLSIIRRELKKKVVTAEKKSGGKGEGYNEFLDRVEMGEDIQILAAINIAESEMVIAFDAEKNKWRWMPEEGKFGNDICIVINSEDKYPELRDFLADHRDILDLMAEKVVEREKVLQK